VNSAHSKAAKNKEQCFYGEKKKRKKDDTGPHLKGKIKTLAKQYTKMTSTESYK
jgi:hypothetical protein